MIKIIFIVIVSFFISACEPNSKDGQYESSKKLVMDDRYLDNNDGTVTDIVTNLTWQRCSVGQVWIGSSSAMDETCGNEPVNINYLYNQDSISWLNGYKEKKGLNKWRVPTKDELRTLVYCSNTSQYDSNGNNDDCGAKDTFNAPTINTDAFPMTPRARYWNSTNHEVSFFSGAVKSGGGNSYVRLVRDND